MYKLIKTQDRMLSQKHQEFVCDTVADIDDLPTATKKADGWILAEVGSLALVIEDSSVYMLGNDKKWHKI